MALISIKKTLLDARQNGYAVPLFDAPSLNAAVGVVRAAEAVHAPVIIGMYDGWLQSPGAEAVCTGMRVLAERASVPVSLMLDHGSSYENCIKAIRYGFTDVMFDGSMLPFEENARISQMIAKAGKAVGVGVEAELGHVGVGADYDIDKAKNYFTQPKMVEKFVKATGVDFLAIAFGTAHGEYKRTPQLDLDLLMRVNAVSPVPLVMHGGSGLSNEQFLGSISRGICKVNIATVIFKDFENRIREKAAEKQTDIFTVEEQLIESYITICTQYLMLFGTAGKA